MRIDANVSLKNYNTWTVGGDAKYFCMPTNEEDVGDALLFADQNDLPWMPLGAGSNVLISDQGFAGLIICLKNFKKIENQSDERYLKFRVQSGLTKAELLRQLLGNRNKAALMVAGIPGQVGGGVAMNAGVSENISPKEFAEIVEGFEVMRIVDGIIERKYYRHEDLQWSYRHCEGWQPGIILNVDLKFKNDPDFNILEKVRKANRVRSEKQPLDMPSCGSVFINPSGHKSALLIQNCGLKGHKIGAAMISNKHCNFFVNLGGATAMDFKNLIEHAQKVVLDQTGVSLVTEVRLVGEFL